MDPVWPNTASQSQHSRSSGAPRWTGIDRRGRFWAASGAEGRRFESCRGHYLNSADANPCKIRATMASTWLRNRLEPSIMSTPTTYTAPDHPADPEAAASNSSCDQ